MAVSAFKNTSSYPLIGQVLHTFNRFYPFFSCFAFDCMVVGGMSDALGYKNCIGSYSYICSGLEQSHVGVGCFFETWCSFWLITLSTTLTEDD